MDLFHKVRVLVGALAHKPFAPRPDSTTADHNEETSKGREREPARSELKRQQPSTEDAERVADLIAQKRRDGSY